MNLHVNGVWISHEASIQPFNHNSKNYLEWHEQEQEQNDLEMDRGIKSRYK